MYENHWKLTARPFENWCDRRFFYPSESHQTTLLKLRYAAENRRAAMVMCGDSGMGKSMLIETLADQLPDSLSPVVRLAFPRLCGDQLLGLVAEELTGVSDPSDDLPLRALRRVDRFLAESIEAQRHPLLVIDEAHLLTDADQLETLRLLLNVHAGRCGAESAWSLVLVGDMTLLSLVERHRALDERIAVKCLLHRFTPEQTRGYVEHRIEMAGGQVDAIFTAAALEMLHQRTAGIPRRINRLADLALMVGYAEDLPQLDAAEIDSVHQELVSVAA